jgi:CheY-like chemotaxis protein
MPEMNGYEAAACIRDPEFGVRDPNIPIIALTAHAMKGDWERCLAAGMNDFVSKPVEPATLSGVLDKWLLREPASLASGPPAEDVREVSDRRLTAGLYDGGSPYRI